MSAYYNEIDPYCAAWLRNLMDAGHIPAGEIDTRSIEDVNPSDLRGFTQCHFFAGLGGWAYGLDLAGWSRDRPHVWTGSCPCQPFSAAGKGAGFADERHLWPAWQHLIAQCRPAIVFGEQVASKVADAWIDLVHADMEGLGYAFGCVAFPAAGVGAPHIRDRTYWVGHADDAGLEGLAGDGCAARREGPRGPAPEAGVPVRMADAARSGRGEERAHSGRIVVGDCAQGVAAGLEHGSGDHRARATNGHWRAADWLACTDGRWRPVEPGTFPLAHGVPGRVGRLRAYGNAIVPQAAAEFVRAYLDCRPTR